MTTVRFNASRMFADIEPWDVSNSQANLGDQCGRLTWGNALRIAENHERWLLCPLADALDYICSWARETGAWGRDEIEAWSVPEALALLVQNVASDLRLCGSDDYPLLSCNEHDCYDEYCERDWEHEPEYPMAHLYVSRTSNPEQNELHGEVQS